MSALKTTGRNVSSEVANNIAVSLPEEVKPILHEADTKLAARVVHVQAFVIQSDEDQIELEAYGQAAAREAEALDRQRRRFVDPLNAQVKLINDDFRGPIQKLKEGIADIVRSKIKAWMEAKRQLQLEDQRRQTNVIYRTEHKVIAEYVKSCKASKSPTLPPDNIKSLLWTDAHVPSDADGREVEVIRLTHGAAVAYMKEAQRKQDEGKAVRTAPVKTAPPPPPPVVAPIEKRVGGSTANEVTMLRVIDWKAIPIQFLVDSHAALPQDEQAHRLTRASRVPICELDCAAVLREFAAGKQVPGLSVKKEISVSFGVAS